MKSTSFTMRLVPKISHNNESEVTKMAYWLTEPETNRKNTKNKSYMCTHLADIEKLPKMGQNGEPKEGDTISPLPCGAGSDCLCLEDSSVWILDEETNEWVNI